MRKTIVALFGAAAILIGLAGPAGAAPASQPLKCFTGGGATCVAGRGGVYTLTVPSGGYAGVYTPANQKLAGGDARNLSLGFTYSGSTGGGAPRLSIPLDANGDGVTDYYLFVDTACDANGDHIVDITEPGCIVSDGAGYYGLYADYPAGRTVTGDEAFLIADAPGTYTVSKIDLR